MKILTAEEMRAADRRTAELGTPLRQLMTAAGESVARFVLQQYPQAERILILCGKGNNGGDGMVAAQALAREGIGVRVLLAGRQADVKGEAAEALIALKAATDGDIVEELPDDCSVEQAVQLLHEADLLLDAVVGTGFKPPLRGPAAILRDAIATLSIPVVALDLPSGWDADSMNEDAQDPEGRAQAFRAGAVITFTAPKLAHIFGHLTAQVFGPVVVAQIGSPPDAIQSTTGLHWSGSAKAITEKPRPINSNKGKFGHVLVIGGSFGKAGAPSMASLACLRAGAGLVTAAVPRSVVNLVAGIAPELMLTPLEEDEQGIATEANLDRLDQLTQGIKLIAIGPGLTTAAAAFARGVVERTTLPLVVDADALNAFKGCAEKLHGKHRTLILTPHPGEFARLVNLTVPQVEADRLALARTFATEHQLTLVLKGWRTLIAHPDGRVAVNTTGNPGLAKGGSGDMLTGIVAALLAQHPDRVAEAVEAAVYLHGLAADLAVRHIDEKSLLVTDVLASLSAAFQHSTTDAQGLTWLCAAAARREPSQEPAW